MTAQLAFDFSLADTPDIIRDLGFPGIHPAPYVSKAKQPGQPYFAFRTSRERAWAYPQIQLAGTRSIKTALVLDIDHAEGMKELGGTLPIPTHTTHHPGGGGHPVWVFETPLAQLGRNSSRQREFYRRIAEGFHAITGADPSYSGLMTDNPYNPAPGRVLALGRRQPFTFGELNDALPYNYQPPKARESVSFLGRNCALFGELCKWAGKPSNVTEAALDRAILENASLSLPLPFREVKGIARSVERYRAQWAAAEGWHTDAFRERQRWRQTKSVAARRKKHGLDKRDREIMEALSAGVSTSALATKHGITVQAIRKIRARDGAKN